MSRVIGFSPLADPFPTDLDSVGLVVVEIVAERAHRGYRQCRLWSPNSALTPRLSHLQAILNGHHPQRTSAAEGTSA